MENTPRISHTFKLDKSTHTFSENIPGWGDYYHLMTPFNPPHALIIFPPVPFKDQQKSRSYVVRWVYVYLFASTCVCLCKCIMNPSNALCMSLILFRVFGRCKKRSWLAVQQFVHNEKEDRSTYQHTPPTHRWPTNSSQYAGKTHATQPIPVCQSVVCYFSWWLVCKAKYTLCFSAYAHVLFVTVYIQYVLPNKTVSPWICYCNDCMDVQ